MPCDIWRLIIHRETTIADTQNATPATGRRCPAWTRPALACATTLTAASRLAPCSHAWVVCIYAVQSAKTNSISDTRNATQLKAELRNAVQLQAQIGFFHERHQSFQVAVSNTLNELMSLHKRHDDEMNVWRQNIAAVLTQQQSDAAQLQVATFTTLLDDQTILCQKQGVERLCFRERYMTMLRDQQYVFKQYDHHLNKLVTSSKRLIDRSRRVTE